MATAQLHVVTGKGGTGKTTVAAALAMAIASGSPSGQMGSPAGQMGSPSGQMGSTSGRVPTSAGGADADRARVLLIEVEGRQGIAQLFDTPPLPYEERRLATAPHGGEVYGLAVDPELAMLEYLEMFYNIKRAGRALRSVGALDFVTTIAPGLRDVLLTGKVKEAVVRVQADGQNVYDAVVLDAPPTGRIRQFLDVTKDVAGLAKMGPIHRQSQGVIKVMHSERTRVHLVTLLEEMPVQETIDAAADLTAAGFALGHVIVNRARPDVLEPGTLKRTATGRVAGARSLAAGLRSSGFAEDRIATLAAALAKQLSDYELGQQGQLSSAARLGEIGRPIIRLPELSPPVDLGGLYELAAALRSGLADEQGPDCADEESL